MKSTCGGFLGQPWVVPSLSALHRRLLSRAAALAAFSPSLGSTCSQVLRCLCADSSQVCPEHLSGFQACGSTNLKLPTWGCLPGPQTRHAPAELIRTAGSPCWVPKGPPLAEDSPHPTRGIGDGLSLPLLALAVTETSQATPSSASPRSCLSPGPAPSIVGQRPHAARCPCVSPPHARYEASQ